MTKISAEAVADLVASFFEAALDDNQWPHILRRCCNLIGADVGVVYCLDFTDISSSFESSTTGDLAATYGFVGNSLQQFEDHYSEVNVWQQNESALSEGAAVTSSELYPDAQLPETEFGHDWLRPQNLFYALGGVVSRSGVQAGKVSLLRSRSAGPFNDDEFQTWSTVVRHLRRALKLRSSMRGAVVQQAGATNVLDLLPQGVVLIALDGKVLYENRAAQTLLRSTRGLFIDAAGALKATEFQKNVRLQRLRVDAEHSSSRVSSLQDGGSMRTVGAGGAIDILVTPVPTVSFQLGKVRTGTVAFLTDPDAKPREVKDSLRSLYGMTEAEAQLAAALSTGLSLKEFAAHRGVTMNTVRTQLKAVMAKTGVKRQAELMKIVLRPW